MKRRAGLLAACSLCLLVALVVYFVDGRQTPSPPPAPPSTDTTTFGSETPDERSGSPSSPGAAAQSAPGAGRDPSNMQRAPERPVSTSSKPTSSEPAPVGPGVPDDPMHTPTTAETDSAPPHEVGDDPLPEFHLKTITRELHQYDPLVIDWVMGNSRERRIPGPVSISPFSAGAQLHLRFLDDAPPGLTSQEWYWCMPEFGICDGDGGRYWDAGLAAGSELRERTVLDLCDLRRPEIGDQKWTGHVTSVPGRMELRGVLLGKDGRTAVSTSVIAFKVRGATGVDAKGLKLLLSQDLESWLAPACVELLDGDETTLSKLREFLTGNGETRYAKYIRFGLARLLCNADRPSQATAELEEVLRDAEEPLSLFAATDLAQILVEQREWTRAAELCGRYPGCRSLLNLKKRFRRLERRIERETDGR